MFPRNDPLLSPTEAAAFLGVSVPALAKWRVNGKGPRYHRLSTRTIRYAFSDLEAFTGQSKHQKTSEYTDAG